jgi:hypothetical protein
MANLSQISILQNIKQAYIHQYIVHNCSSIAITSYAGWARKRHLIIKAHLAGFAWLNQKNREVIITRKK